MDKKDKEFITVNECINNNEFKEKLLEWNKILDEKCRDLMISLWLLKSGANQEIIDKYIDENTNKTLSNFINENDVNINKKVMAYIYYSRFENLIQNLKAEYKDQNENIKKLVSYYLFDNKIKELIWYGGGYYYNVKLRNKRENLFRATIDINEDNKKFTRIKNYINCSMDSVYIKLKNKDITEDEYNKILKITKKNTDKQSTIFKTLVVLAVGQVNGSEIALPSYSKCLGVALYKYAHGKCSLIVKEKAPINVIKFNNELINSFYDLKESNDKSLRDVNGFSIDFSTVRDENINNLNDWLSGLFGSEKNICKFGSPISDRHVVDTNPINKNDKIIILSDIELIFLLRIYKKMVCKESDILILKRVNDVKDDILTQLNSVIKAMKNIMDKDVGEDKDKIENILRWKKEIKSICKLLSDIQKLDNKELEKISEKLNFITIIDWKKEEYYFKKFMRPKKPIEFFYRTEKRSNEHLKWIIVKHTLLEINEESKIDEGGI